MCRPILWLGAAVIIGEILGFLLDSRLKCIVSILLILVTIIVYLKTGIQKIKTQKEKCIIFLMPVFLMLGFLSVCNEAYLEKQHKLYIEKIPEVLNGKIIDIEQKNGYDQIFVKINHPLSTTIVVTSDHCLYERGDQICINGKITAFDHGTNPGTYDAYEFYKQEHIYYQIRNPKMTLIKQCNHPLIKICTKIESYIKKILDYYMNQKDANTLKAMILGALGEMDVELKDLYQSQGIAHIFAVSGLHMSFVGMGLYKLLRKIYAPIWAAGIFSCVIILGYGFLTGFGVSVIRAMIMMMSQIFAQFIGRTYDGKSAWILAGVIILIQYPSKMFQMGFLLSFLCVWILLLLQEMKHIKKQYAGVWIFLGNLPILVWFNYEIPLYSMITNAIIIPLMSIVYPLSLIAIGLSCLNMSMGAFVIAGCHWILWLFERIATWISHWPLSVIIVGKPDLWKIILIEISILLIMCLPKYIPKCQWRYVLLLSFALLFLNKNYGKTQIIYVDVGQGDCNIIMHDDGTVTMIDGGSLSKKEIGKYVISKVLKYYGISCIDRVVITHMDQDHMNGILELIEMDYPIQSIYISEQNYKLQDEIDILIKAKEKHIQLQSLSTGDKLCFGNMNLWCLNPKNESQTTEIDSNEASIVLLGLFRQHSFLFTGDLEGASEGKVAALLEKMNRDWHIDVLKVAHHGSKNSTADAFLDIIKPKWAMISSGKNNKYGHPHKETMQRLRAHQCHIVETAKQGAIKATSNGQDLKIYAIMKQ